MLHFVERNKHTTQSLLRNIDNIAKPKSKFCAFMYNHDVGHRNQLFHNISKMVGPVDSLGRCCHPDGPRVETDRRTYQPGRVTFYDTAVDKYANYRFVICCENEIGLPGYIKEKIINAYLAGAIPIYRGAPDVVSIFNPKSFINGNGISDVELCQKIKIVLADEKLYQLMLQEPVFIDNKLPKWFDYGLYSILLGVKLIINNKRQLQLLRIDTHHQSVDLVLSNEKLNLDQLRREFIEW